MIDDWTPDRAAALASQTTARLLDSTLSRTEISRALDLDDTALAHLIDTRQLHAIHHAGERRYPRWQLRHGRLLPGLAVLVPVLHDTGLDPVSVATFMGLPNDELDDASPADFLAAGGTPHTTIATLLEAWARR